MESIRRFPLALSCGGLIALFVGERIATGSARWLCDATAATFIILAVVLAHLRRRHPDPKRRHAYSLAFVAHLIIASGVALYAVQLTELGLFDRGTWRTLLSVIWPTLVILGSLLALMVESAIAATAKSPAMEIERVRMAWRAAWGISLTLISFATLNFAAAQWNRKLDLSYFKTTKPGDSTRNIVTTLTQPVTVLMFFPPANDVAEHAMEYFKDLEQHNPLFKVEFVDQALHPEIAKEYSIQNNGNIVFSSGERHEVLKLDLDLEMARSRLRELDSAVQERLLKILRPPRLAYFTTGHLERDYQPPADDHRAGLANLRTLLEGQGFKIKRLGLGEGLATHVPDNASLVVVIDPLEAFLPEERTSLLNYFKSGGRLLLAFDPDAKVIDESFLAALGLKMSRAYVANERHSIRLENQAASAYNLITNRASSHPATMTLNQNSGRMGVIVLGAGSLSKIAPAPSDLKITFILHAMAESFIDSNGNGQQDKASEPFVSPEFAAAVESVSSADSEKNTARALVVADADAIGNTVLRNAGNAYFWLDGVRWLAGDDAAIGPVESEKDVPIVHRKEEDAWWFYGTSFILPAAILVGGWWLTRRRLKRWGV